VRRKLLKSASFIRAVKRLVKRNPQAAANLQATLELLAENAFHSTLKTHKLKGDLADSWACSASYDIRIVFEFVEHEGTEAILLQSAGTHDEVY